MKFLKDFQKATSKMEGVAHSSAPPRYWYGTGNFVLNRVISGSFYKGIPQGRITALAGPSASGKSFLAGNIVKNAQADGAFVLMVDSENAFDDDFAEAIGIDISPENYMYKGVATIPIASKIIQSFIKSYKAEYGDDANAPQVLIMLDSLDMLMTESEQKNYMKGDTAGDQGQRAKQLKAMLRTFVQDIKDTNIAMVVTTQVYKASAQQILEGEGAWIVNNAIRFALSQIILLTKLKLKDKEKNVSGIRMKCQGFKTRFTKPFQEVTIEVPYDKGIDPASGLIDVAVQLDILAKKGAYLSFCHNDSIPNFYEKDLSDDHIKLILELAEAKTHAFLEIAEDIEEDDEPEGKKGTALRRKQKAIDSTEEE